MSDDDPDRRMARTVMRAAMVPPRLPSDVTSDVASDIAHLAAASSAQHTLVSAASVLPGADSPASGQVLGGKYRLVRLLGAGGMGQVFKGEHLVLGIPIAVKTMHAYSAAIPEDRRRFLREARAASMLRHPNVVQVLDFGDEDGLLYLVMEYLDGQSLGAWLREGGRLPALLDIAPIIGSIFDAVEVAHAYGIVHRDLKPDNVFLTDVGGHRVVKVVDFGLAHLDDALDTGPTLTARDVVAGTPEYMSPEQCRSLVVGPSADLYAIGCILTTMLQGRPPFTGVPPVELLAKHMFSPPPPLSRPPGAEPVPPLLERLRLDLLSKSPERRPRSGAAARIRLEEAMSPAAEARRLPTRKGDEPMGSRLERAPAWASTDAAIAPDQESSQHVGLLRLAPAGAGLSDACELGLDAQGLHLVEAPDVDALAQGDFAVAVLDAGSDVDAACELLGELARVAPRTRVVVCAAGLGADRMNALVAAGAADAARHPVTSDVLARKLRRVLRRGR